ncbi:hypothetical protein AT05_10860 [Schleiferia thermophila str. Yellowstone]|jgi:hypothetical protein|nr:hypothetical protein AT05_10860 [Schleiferia thermophila str. Yellowstone]
MYQLASKTVEKEGQATVVFVTIKPREDLWLLFHLGLVKKTYTQWGRLRLSRPA